ncbi:MAG: creatininase family protein [Chloroflexi bacterium]|nr:creatininase family protein [Chloroflexota bacterium]
MATGSAYDHHTWPEIREIPKDDRVAMLPVGAVEQHGPHLPINTDNKLVWTVCSEAARRAPEDILLLPLVPYGYCGMMMDYPGTISIEIDTLVSYLYDIVKSLAKHRFKRVLIVNGHGGNRAILETVGRRANAELGIACAGVTYWSLIAKQLQELRDSEPGGITHACEMETSLYLHLDVAKVQMDKAVKDIAYPAGEFFGLDFVRARVADYNPPWSTFSKSGVLGDPTVATAQKGAIWLDAAADRLVALVREFKSIVLHNGFTP